MMQIKKNLETYGHYPMINFWPSCQWKFYLQYDIISVDRSFKLGKKIEIKEYLNSKENK